MAKRDTSRLSERARRTAPRETRFDEVIELIEAARGRAYRAVNAELVTLCWELGRYIGGKIDSAEWGDGVVDALAESLARRFPGVRGYTRRNLFRMRQFFEAWPDPETVSALLTQLPWTHHLIILGQAKPPESRHYYLAAAVRDRWSSRELADLGQLSFYVEALDREVRKAHERPSIGVLLCATKDDEVVEYALARTTSPTLVAEYQTFLPSREELRAKLHELYAGLAHQPDDESS